MDELVLLVDLLQVWQWRQVWNSYCATVTAYGHVDLPLRRSIQDWWSETVESLNSLIHEGWIIECGSRKFAFSINKNQTSKLQTNLQRFCIARVIKVSFINLSVKDLASPLTVVIWCVFTAVIFHWLTGKCTSRDNSEVGCWKFLRRHSCSKTLL